MRKLLFIFLFVPSFLFSQDRANDILNQLYTDFKLNSGYTGNEIVAKARSLKGVLEPLSTEQNLELLEQTGFSNPTIIHKTLCFDGILAIK